MPNLWGIFTEVGSGGNGAGKSKSAQKGPKGYGNGPGGENARATQPQTTPRSARIQALFDAAASIGQPTEEPTDTTS